MRAPDTLFRETIFFLRIYYNNKIIFVIYRYFEFKQQITSHFLPLVRLVIYVNSPPTARTHTHPRDECVNKITLSFLRPQRAARYTHTQYKRAHFTSCIRETLFFFFLGANDSLICGSMGFCALLYTTSSLLGKMPLHFSYTHCARKKQFLYKKKTIDVFVISIKKK